MNKRNTQTGVPARAPPHISELPFRLFLECNPAWALFLRVLHFPELAKGDDPSFDHRPSCFGLFSENLFPK